MRASQAKDKRNANPRLLSILRESQVIHTSPALISDSLKQLKLYLYNTNDEMVAILQFKRDFPQGCKVFDFSELATSIVDSNLEFTLRGCIAIESTPVSSIKDATSSLLPTVVMEMVDTQPKQSQLMEG